MDESAKASVRGIELPTSLSRLRRPIPRRARQVLREGARRYGALTADYRLGPDFLVIGAKKAGTSSLTNWLMQHQAVARLFPATQRTKSPHYFDMNYWRGPRWYASHFPTRAARHHQERRVGAVSVVGEASPYYLFHPAVPERVAVDLPDVRVIALLREPVSRAYSNYWDRRAFGSEDLETFEAAIEAEPRRMAEVDSERLRHDPRYYSFHHDHHSYLARGCYAEQLAPWMAVVPPERLLVLPAEGLFRAPAETFAEVLRFLRLPPHEGLALAPFNRRAHPPIQESTRRQLADFYRPHNEALYELLGRDLGW